MSRRGALARGVLTATAAVLMFGVAAPVAATAAPAEVATAGASALPGGAAGGTARTNAALGTSDEEKVRALAALGIFPDNDLLLMSDRDFVFELWRRSPDRKTDVKAAALAAHDQGRENPEVCALFVRVGVYDANERDKAREAQEENAARLEREAKARAAAVLGIVAPPELVALSDWDFIAKMWKHPSAGPKVKAAAFAVLQGSPEERTRFIATGLRDAHTQDVLDAIEADKERTEAEKAAARHAEAKKRAAAVIPMVPTPEVLLLTDDNFVRELWKKAAANTEVKASAMEALFSSDPADWKAFIYTGIHQANDRDKANELRKQAEENRRAVREIQAKAESSLVHPALVAAAAKALAGSDLDVDRFLRIGQYNVLSQSVRTTAPRRSGWYVQGSGGDAVITPGDPGPTGSAPVKDATWKIVAGLADPNCVSLESVDQLGLYLKVSDLRVRLEASDGSDGFKNAATWCARKSGPGVAFESKSHPGRVLRHSGTGLWAAAKGGDHVFDRACGFAEQSSWQIDAPNPQVTERREIDRRSCLDVPVADKPLAFYDYGNGRTGLWRFDGIGGHVAPRMLWDSGNGNWSAGSGKYVAGDFTGDGRKDAAAFYDYGRGQTKLWLFSDVTGGAPSISQVWDSGPGNWHWPSIAPVVGDFDDDGRTDLASFYDYGNGRTGLWRFDGLGGKGPITTRMIWDSGNGNWASSSAKYVAGDFNGDGKAEAAAFYDYGGGVTKLWMFDGLGTAKASVKQAWDSGPGNWYWPSIAPVVGDFDADGTADIGAFYDYGSGRTGFWRFENLGGTVSAQMPWDSGNGNWASSRAKYVAGDFDADGRTEAAALYDYGNGVTKLWVFDGLGTGKASVGQAWDSGPGNWHWPSIAAVR